MAKNFNTNDLMGFIDTTPEPEYKDIEAKTLKEMKTPKSKESKPRGRKPTKPEQEKRLDHFNMVINHSLFEDLKTLSHMRGVSVSSLVHETLEALVKENQGRIKDYRKLIEK